MSNGVRIDKDGNAVIGTRKLRESGNSIVLTIPKQVLQTAGFEAGERVSIRASMDGDTITIEHAAEPEADGEE